MPLFDKVSMWAQSAIWGFIESVEKIQLTEEEANYLIDKIKSRIRY